MHDALFAQIAEEIPGYAGAVVGSLDGRGYTAHTPPQGFDLAPLAGELPGLMARYHGVYEGLGGKIDFGGNDELLISASRGYLMVRVDHASRQFVGVLLKSSGNLGYLRFRMRNYLKQIGRGAA